jgi:dTDP-4-dehydrorhamnose 3,5-epimerase-like enzyme
MIRKIRGTGLSIPSLECYAKNRHLLYVPEVFYQTTAPYCIGAEKNLRWNDPSFNIEWPLPVQLISQKDSEHPLFAETE